MLRLVSLLFLLLFSVAAASLTFDLPPLAAGEKVTVEFLRRHIMKTERKLRTDILATCHPAVKVELGIQFFTPILEHLDKCETPSKGIRMIFESYYRIFGRSLSTLEDLHLLALSVGLTSQDPEYLPEYKKVLEEFDNKEEVEIKPASSSISHQLQDADNVGTYTKQEIEGMLNIISDFESYDGKLDEMINTMFPNFDNFDEALNYAIKNCLLYHRAVKNIGNEAWNIPANLFSDPLNREITLKAMNTAPPFVAFSNGLLRLLAEAKMTKNIKSLTLAHKLLMSAEVNGAEPMDLPIRPDQEFKKVAYGLTSRQRAFLLVRLAQFKCTVKSSHIGFPMSWKIAHPLSYMFSYQMMLALEPFVDYGLLADEFNEYLDLRIDFMKDVCFKEIKSTVSNQLFKKMITTTLEAKVKSAFKNPKYQKLSALDAETMAFLLMSTSKPTENTANSVIDFESPDVDVAAPKAKPRKKRKGKKAAKQVQEDLVQTQEDTLRIIEDANIEKGEHAVEALVLDNEKAEDILVQSVAANSSKADHFEDGEKSEKMEVSEEIALNTEEIKIQEEIDELLLEHQQTLERYKKLKKLKVDHSKLLDTRFKVVSELAAPQQRSCLVASFSTEDWRMIHSEANEVFIQNQLDGSANYANLRSKTMNFQWVFNRKITIDLETYRFLCQLFNLSSGRNLLTFDNFLRAFAMINPSKGRLISDAFLSKGKKKKVRFVFQSEHAIQANGVTYVPPIGGAHCEHASSRFNHKRIHDFVMYSGAHPYFFLKMQD